MPRSFDQGHKIRIFSSTFLTYQMVWWHSLYQIWSPWLQDCLQLLYSFHRHLLRKSRCPGSDSKCCPEPAFITNSRDTIEDIWRLDLLYWKLQTQDKANSNEKTIRMQTHEMCFRKCSHWSTNPKRDHIQNVEHVTLSLVDGKSLCLKWLKLTWTVIYPWKRQPYFSCELISKTWYWLDVCYGWFHLHRLTRTARGENRELQNEKFLPIPGLELTTPDFQV